MLFKQENVGLPLAAAAAVAQTLLRERASEGADPFSRRDGWRSHGLVQRRFEFDFGGSARQGQPDLPARRRPAPDGGRGRRTPCPARWRSTTPGAASTCSSPASAPGPTVYAQGETDHVFTPQGATQIVAIDLLAHAGEAQDEGGRLTAPMPGKVVSFCRQGRRQGAARASRWR